jgi:hypothetical protein
VDRRATVSGRKRFRFREPLLQTGDRPKSTQLPIHVRRHGRVFVEGSSASTTERRLAQPVPHVRGGVERLGVGTGQVWYGKAGVRIEIWPPGVQPRQTGPRSSPSSNPGHLRQDLLRLKSVVEVPGTRKRSGFFNYYYFFSTPLFSYDLQTKVLLELLVFSFLQPQLPVLYNADIQEILLTVLAPSYRHH